MHVFTPQARAESPQDTWHRLTPGDTRTRASPRPTLGSLWHKPPTATKHGLSTTGSSDSALASPELDLQARHPPRQSRRRGQLLPPMAQPPQCPGAGRAEMHAFGWVYA